MEAFFGCKVEFSAHADEIVLPDSIGQVPISSADPYLDELLIDYCEEALSRRRRAAVPCDRTWRMPLRCSYLMERRTRTKYLTSLA